MSTTILLGIYILTIFILIAFTKIKVDIFDNDRLNLLKSFHLSADDDHKLWLLDYQKENLNTYHNVHLFFVIFVIFVMSPLFLAFDNTMLFVLIATASYAIEIFIAYKILDNLKELKKLKYSMENELKKSLKS